MAALFYTNHRIGTVNELFYVWRNASLAKQEERMRQLQSQKKGSAKPGKPIQIDVELANQDAFQNYHHINAEGVPQ